MPVGSRRMSEERLSNRYYWQRWQSLNAKSLFNDNVKYDSRSLRKNSYVFFIMG